MIRPLSAASRLRAGCESCWLPAVMRGALPSPDVFDFFSLIGCFPLLHEKPPRPDLGIAGHRWLRRLASCCGGRLLLYCSWAVSLGTPVPGVVHRRRPVIEEERNRGLDRMRETSFLPGENVQPATVPPRPVSTRANRRLRLKGLERHGAGNCRGDCRRPEGPQGVLP